MMGATVGRDVWFEALTVTEFDVAELGDGCAVNRNGVVETHLFHDRLMRIGPAKLGARRHPRPGGRDAAGHDDRRTLQRRRPLGRDARRTATRTDALARRTRARRLMHGEGVRIAVPPGGPEVRLLDARTAGLDEPGLRAAGPCPDRRDRGVTCVALVPLPVRARLLARRSA